MPRIPTKITSDSLALTRRSLMTAVATAGVLTTRAGGALAQPATVPPDGPGGAPEPTVGVPLARQFGRWAASLRYEDLPAAVVDRAKGVTLHALASALLGSQMESSKDALALLLGEESGVKKGATVWVDGSILTASGAAFVNSEMAYSGGKWDTFRMLTHPGTSILPAALAAAESSGATGREFITAIAAGYEVSGRMSAEFIPTVMARGFHAGPVFGIFGAAVAAAKILRLSEDEITAAIGLCVNLAGSNLESRGLREGVAVRNGLLAVALARQGARGRETALEGPAGFYHAFAGNNQGRLSHSFTGLLETNLADITKGLGRSGCSSRRCIASTRFPATTWPTSISRPNCARSTASAIRTSSASKPSRIGWRRSTRARPSRRSGRICRDRHAAAARDSMQRMEPSREASLCCPARPIRPK